jgi:hypothetical protein
MLVKCMYCDTDNDATATGGFCEGCGKRLPRSAMVRPRRTIAGLETTPDSTAAPLPPQRAVVSEALTVGAVVHLVVGGGFLVVGGLLFREVPARFGPTVLSWTLLPTVLVVGMAWLARYRPESSVVLTLVLWLAWVGATFLVNPELAAGWLIVQLVLFVFLARAGWLAFRPRRRSTGA